MAVLYAVNLQVMRVQTRVEGTKNAKLVACKASCRQRLVSYRLILHVMEYYSVIMHEELRAGWLAFSSVVKRTDCPDTKPAVTHCAVLSQSVASSFQCCSPTS